MSKYLLDSNSLITPHRQYYPFDFAESFWEQLHEKLLIEPVFILKVVCDEITRNANDALSSWIKKIDIPDKILEVSNDSAVFENYRKVLQYIQECQLYKESSWKKWMDEKVADPWLIAVAMCCKYKIVTNEQSAGSLSVNQQCCKSAPKIPDVANHFKVECISLFDFMRQMNFKL